MFDQFTVKQNKGGDTLVTVYQDTKRGWPKDDLILRFQTDQSLTTNSDRSYEVNKAIEQYARERGYEVGKPNKNEVVAIYSAQAHSRHLTWQIWNEIKTDPRYESAVSDAIKERDDINREMGIAIRQLKNLVIKLENKNQERLAQLDQHLLAVQSDIVSGINIPPEVQEHHREGLLNPSYPLDRMNMDHYATYGQGYNTIPDIESFADILKLL